MYYFIDFGAWWYPFQKPSKRSTGRVETFHNERLRTKVLILTKLLQRYSTTTLVHHYVLPRCSTTPAVHHRWRELGGDRSLLASLHPNFMTELSCNPSMPETEQLNTVCEQIRIVVPVCTRYAQPAIKWTSGDGDGENEMNNVVANDVRMCPRHAHLPQNSIQFSFSQLLNYPALCPFTCRAHAGVQYSVNMELPSTGPCFCTEYCTHQTET